MTPFSQARMIVLGAVITLFVSLGIYAWYQHAQSTNKSKKIEVFEAKEITHAIDINATAIASQAKGEIKQIDKEEKHEVSTSVGIHNALF